MQLHYIYITFLFISAQRFQSTVGQRLERDIVGTLDQSVTDLIEDIESFLGLITKPIAEDVTFWCATPLNSEFVELLVTDNSSVIETTLNNTLDLVFLIHGWTDSYLDDWVRTLVNQFVEYNDANICVVDWSRLAFMKYLLSAQATLPVGNYLGSFIQNLTDNGIFDISQITLIGHSMGAHVAGIAGFYLNSTVPTIIGLDPAGPAFTKFPLRPINERLDATDASFVQIIHTDRYFIGSNMDLGTEDFYPNGGFAPQPGCEVSINNSPINYLNIFCSHWKSYQYFTASLNSSTVFTGTKCNNYLLYLLGLCSGQPTDSFGLYASKTTSGRLFLHIPSLT